MEPTAAIYEGTAGPRLTTSTLTVVGADGHDLVAEAQRLAKDGWARVELCGGVSVDVAEDVRSALPAEVRVGLNRYGFESLERIADYKRAFARGEIWPAAFLIPADAGSPRVDHADATIIPVSTPGHVETVAAGLADAGYGLIELYGGLGTVNAAAAVRGAAGRVPVGFVGYDD